MAMRKNTIVGTKLLKALARGGHRIFEMALAKKYAPESNIKLEYLNEALTHLKQNGWIHKLRNGLYALDISFLGGIPIHEHEIAMFLVRPAAISHFSAFQYHGLTDQIPHAVYISTLNTSIVPRLSSKSPLGPCINGIPYIFIKIKSDHFFGFTERWEASTKIVYTDYERTLLDGLCRPDLCGGIQEVLYAFQHNIDSLNIPKIIDYALKHNIAVTKRLGWALESLKISSDALEPLKKRAVTSYTKLNMTADAKGSFNKQWMIIENI